MFRVALFIITKTQKHPKCPLMDKDDVIIHTHTHTHPHAQEYYLAIKKNKIMPFAAKCMDLDII